MSIFSKLAGVVVGAAKGFVTGGAGGALLGGVGSLVGAPRAVAPVAGPTIQPALQQIALPGAGFPPPAALPVMSRLPAFGSGAVRPATRELALAGGACPVGFHLDKRTRSRCVRNRRMNPLNGKAATRAIRRIKGARKMLQKIERQLPRAKARATPRHGHRTTVTAT